ncbi:MAG: hypothetical protein Q8O34_11250, partial [Rhodocyclaceae bacterium]|nr:hypothetical protein [Rhodocyclaceae bacterium]
AYRRGDFTQRMPNDWTGVPGKIADTLNDIIDMADRTVGDFERVSREAGKAGKVSARMTAADPQGAWARLADSGNTLIDDLISPMDEMVRVIEAVSGGDLTRRVPTQIDGRPLEGRFLKSAEIINGMVGRLATFAAEVTRVAREVGTDGKLGGQKEAQSLEALCEITGKSRSEVVRDSLRAYRLREALRHGQAQLGPAARAAGWLTEDDILQDVSADVPDPADDNDARLVAAAVTAGADLFVTGDKRVLEWIASGSMRIASPRQAWIILFEPQLNH